MDPVLRRLAVKRHATLSNLSEAERDCLLDMAARSIAPERDVSEAEVNGALRQWLGALDDLLWIDHVELRRTLTDSGRWQRDGFGRRYRRSAPINDSKEPFEALLVARQAWRDAREARRQAHVLPDDSDPAPAA